MAPGEQVAFEPALAHVLAQHFHDAAVGGDVIVVGQDLGRGGPVGHFEHRAQAIGGGFVRTEDAEIVRRRHSASSRRAASLPARAWLRRPRCRAWERPRVVAEIGQTQILQQQTAVGVRIGSHAARALGRQLGQFRESTCPSRSNSSSRAVALHPVLRACCRCSGLAAKLGQRHLVRAEGAFDLHAVDDLGAGPALGRVAARSSARAGAS